MTADSLLSVIAPLFNEEANVDNLVARISSIAPEIDCRLEIILVDDGSSDETYSTAIRLQSKSDLALHVLRHENNRGIVPSWATGLKFSTADYACLIDGDLQNPPESIVDLFGCLRSYPDRIIQGVRSPVTRSHSDRKVLSRVFNSLLNFAFRDDAQDFKSGFLLARRKNLVQCLPNTALTIFPQSFVRARGRKMGLEFVEVNTGFHDRSAGTSFLERRGYLFNGLLSLLDFPLAISRYRGRRLWTPKGSSGQPVARQPVAASRDPIVKLREAFYFRTMPLHSWQITQRETLGAYEFLNESQNYRRDEIITIQSERLDSLLAHASAHVPFYRNRQQTANSGPESAWPLLSGVPLLTKDLVRTNAHMRLFTERIDPKRVQAIRTSGSTGEPFLTYADSYQLAFRFASTLRAHRWTGWDFGAPQVRLWHQKIGMNTTQVFKERLDARLLNRSFVPAFEFDPRELEALRRHLNARRPFLIDGYAESLNFLAAFLNQGGRLEFSPSAVMSSAQTLTSQTRSNIEASLGSRVFDKYGAREFSGIAYQCGHDDRFHVMDESYVVEVLVDGRPARPGELGEVVITDLNNFTFPLIRYRIGDLAMQVEQHPCNCGRNLSSLGRIEGRTQALIFCSNGRWLPGTFFAHFFKDFDYAIRFFQVQQDVPGEFRLLVVPAKGWSTKVWASIESELREFIGSTSVMVEVVDQIPLTRTGKRTPVVANAKVDFQELGATNGSE